MYTQLAASAHNDLFRGRYQYLNNFMETMQVDDSERYVPFVLKQLYSQRARNVANMNLLVCIKSKYRCSMLSLLQYSREQIKLEAVMHYAQSQGNKPHRSCLEKATCVPAFFIIIIGTLVVVALGD